MKQPTTSPAAHSATENHDQPLSLAVLLETAQSVQGRLESMMEEVGLTPAKFQAIDALARDVDTATLEVFGFAGARCDRIIARVLEALRRRQ